MPLWKIQKNWDIIADTVVESNLFQKSNSASTRRIFREIRQRLQNLDEQTLEDFDQFTRDEQKIVLLIAACKCYPFLFDFIQTVLANKLMVFDHHLKQEDFDAFWNRSQVDYPELEKIADSTRKKIRQVTFRLLAEAGLLSSTQTPQITPIQFPATIEGVLQREGEIYRGALLIS